MKNTTLKTIFENIHGIAVNMNDTFYYSCADVAVIDSDELEDLEPVIELYGRDAFIAYEAIRRGHNPEVSKNVTINFLAAKEMIEEIMVKADEFGAFFTLRAAVKMKASTPKERKKQSKLLSKVSNWFTFFTHR